MRFDIVSSLEWLNDTATIHKLEKSFQGYMEFNADTTFEMNADPDKKTVKGYWKIIDSGLFYMLNLIPADTGENSKPLDLTIREIRESYCFLAVYFQDGGAFGYINFHLSRIK